jgi:hypothetical protein
MPISVHAVRRVAVAVAVTCATVLSSTAALAAVHRDSGLLGTPRCLTAQLRISLGPGNGTAGSVVYPLRFTNLGRATCHLGGYPGVAGVNRRGQQLGSAADRAPVYRPRLVTLRPGATVHAMLAITEAGNFPSRVCRVRPAAGLRVLPPNAFRSKFVRLSFAACSRKGPRYLHVSAVRAGRG